MTDWNDRIIDEHQRRINEMRHVCSTQMKFGLYRNPAFKFYHSLGITDLFQGFKNNDLDLGVYHLYWDKDAINTIEYYDPKTGERTNNIKGDWRERWYEPGEEIEPVEMDGPGRPDPVKLMKWWVETHASIQAKILLNQKEKAEAEDAENRPWHHLPKPEWEN